MVHEVSFFGNGKLSTVYRARSGFGGTPDFVWSSRVSRAVRHPDMIALDFLNIQGLVISFNRMCEVFSGHQTNSVFIGTHDCASFRRIVSMVQGS